MNCHGMFVHHFNRLRKCSNLTKRCNIGSQVGKCRLQAGFYCLRVEISSVRKFHAFLQVEGIGQAIVADVPRFSQSRLKFTAFPNNERIIAVTGIVGETVSPVGSGGRHRRIKASGKIPTLGSRNTHRFRVYAFGSVRLR